MTPESCEKLTQERYPYIALFGAVGIGKTTFSEFIAAETEVTLLQEHYPDNPYLHDFYTKNPADYSFYSQMFFLANKGIQVTKINELTKKGPVVLDPGHEADFVIATVQYKMGWMTDEQYSTYLNAFNRVYKDVLNPDVYITLKDSEENVIKKIIKRGREMELSMHKRYPGYFPSIVREFNKLISGKIGLTTKHAIEIDMDRVDFVDGNDSRKEIIKEIKNQLSYQIYSPTQRNMIGSDGARLIMPNSFPTRPRFQDSVPGIRRIH